MYITQDATSAVEALLILMADPKAVKKQLEELKLISKTNDEKMNRLHQYEVKTNSLVQEIETHKKELDLHLRESLRRYEAELKAKERLLVEELDKAFKLKAE